MSLLTQTILKWGGDTKDKQYFSFSTEKERDEKKREIENRGYKKIYVWSYTALCGVVYYLYF